MCKFFLQNSCTKGAACEFAHHEAELGTRWQCSSCGFANVEVNEICGGTGSLGCKVPRPAATTRGPVQINPKAGLKIGMCKFFVENSCTKGAACDFAHSEAELGTIWHCGSCGFANVEVNEICGGTGSLGCKAPRPTATTRRGPVQNGLKLGMCKFFLANACTKGAACEFAHNEAELGTRWQCSSCGFANVEVNEICGGTGSLGCKVPRPAATTGVAAHVVQKVGQSSMPAAMARVPAQSTPKAGLKQSMCKFFLANANVEANDICGGTGSLGCKAPRQGASHIQTSLFARKHAHPYAR
eukprot:TRINITY_DN7774_c0_g1_i9.p1 TRINITY_DN7774_c0_g1~~TRINITY_DN7774_c0_g1_i9.p1  ORF type:complete len:351 (+),score=69.24 TRINITY_DN7774_c0_g1_i9:157-1053(+)